MSDKGNQTSLDKKVLDSLLGESKAYEEKGRHEMLSVTGSHPSVDKSFVSIADRFVDPEGYVMFWDDYGDFIVRPYGSDTSKALSKLIDQGKILNSIDENSATDFEPFENDGCGV